jgi:hypothetical protein
MIGGECAANITIDYYEVSFEGRRDSIEDS